MIDEKGIRVKLASLEAEHKKDMDQRRGLQERVDFLTQEMLKIEGAHQILAAMLNEGKDVKEGLQAEGPKPDVPGSVPEGTIVAEVVR